MLQFPEKISLQGTPIFERHAFSPLSEVTTIKSLLLSRASFAVAAIIASIEAKLCISACIITFFASSTVAESNGSIPTVKTEDLSSQISPINCNHALIRFLFHFFLGDVYR